MSYNAVKHLGVNLEEPDTTQVHPLGFELDISWGTNKDKFSRIAYIFASDVLTKELIYQYRLLPGSNSGKVLTPVTTTVVGALGAIGDKIACCVPLVTLAQGEYGWAIVQGHMTINSSATIAAGKALYTTATSGAVDDTTTSVHLFDGLISLEARTGAGAFNAYALNRLTATKTV